MRGCSENRSCWTDRAVETFSSRGCHDAGRYQPDRDKKRKKELFNLAGKTFDLKTPLTFSPSIKSTESQRVVSHWLAVTIYYRRGTFDRGKKGRRKRRRTREEKKEDLSKRRRGRIEANWICALSRPRDFLCNAKSNHLLRFNKSICGAWCFSSVDWRNRTTTHLHHFKTYTRNKVPFLPSVSLCIGALLWRCQNIPGALQYIRDPTVVISSGRASTHNTLIGMVCGSPWASREGMMS